MTSSTPSVSHVIPALIKTIVDAKESGADHIVVWGTGAASREFLYVDDAAEGVLLAAEHYDGAEPVNLGSNAELFIRISFRRCVGSWASRARFVGTPPSPTANPGAGRW